MDSLGFSVSDIDGMQNGGILASQWDFLLTDYFKKISNLALQI